MFGPYWISLLLLKVFALGLAAIAGWIGTTAVGIFSGKSSKTDGQTQNVTAGKTCSNSWEDRPGCDPGALRKARYICLDLIQLMENAYTDLHFRNRADRCNPSNGGWIPVFRYWTRQDIFQRTWLFAAILTIRCSVSSTKTWPPEDPSA